MSFVMVGWKVRWVAGLLALIILVDAFLAHAFWAYPATERHGQLLHVLKNLSTLGGLMLLAWFDAVRMRSFLEELAAECDGQQVLLIGHSATLWMLEHWLRDRPLEAVVGMFPERPWRFALEPQP